MCEGGRLFAVLSRVGAEAEAEAEAELVVSAAYATRSELAEPFWERGEKFASHFQFNSRQTAKQRPDRTSRADPRRAEPKFSSLESQVSSLESVLAEAREECERRIIMMIITVVLPSRRLQSGILISRCASRCSRAIVHSRAYDCDLSLLSHLSKLNTTRLGFRVARQHLLGMAKHRGNK